MTKLKLIDGGYDELLEQSQQALMRWALTDDEQAIQKFRSIGHRLSQRGNVAVVTPQKIPPLGFAQAITCISFDLI